MHSRDGDFDFELQRRGFRTTYRQGAPQNVRLLTVNDDSRGPFTDVPVNFIGLLRYSSAEEGAERGAGLSGARMVSGRWNASAPAAQLMARGQFRAGDSARGALDSCAGLRRSGDLEGY
ncbi:Protein of unknown function [Gryllus bimaculatus]|nr:Protein of unknown function [Gryllus bimaculatus]